MSVVKDRISVTYSSIEDLFSRQEIIEDRVINYIKENPQVADTTRSSVIIGKDKFVLEVELIKD